MRPAVPRPRPPRGDEGLVALYLKQIGGRPLLTAAEEQQLAREIEVGRQAREQLEGAATLPTEARHSLEALTNKGERAAEVFVEANLRLVVSIARRYVPSGMPLLDLIQEGNIGLLRAVERFDHRRGVRFSTFATWLIRQAIVRAIANTSRLIRLPVRAGEVCGRVRSTAQSLESDLGRAPTTAELAAALGMTVERTAEVLRQAETPLSLSSPVRGGEVELGEIVPDPAGSALDAILASLLPHQVARLLADLTERERVVVTLRYGLGDGEPQSLAAVGRRLNLSAEGTRSVQRQAIRKLRAVVERSDDARELLAG